MRRFLVPLLGLALLAPAAAPAAQRADGTLAIRDGAGGFGIYVRGAAIGRVGAGTLEVEIPYGGDCGDLDVWTGDDRELKQKQFTAERDVPTLGPRVTVCRFIGRKFRFRLVGQVAVRLKWASDVNVSVVGRGYVTLKGAGGDDGKYSDNGDPFRGIPNLPVSVLLAAGSTP